MKWIIPVVLALIVVLYVSVAYAQVGPCTIYTIVQPDGTIKNCTVCGTIVNCS